MHTLDSVLWCILCFQRLPFKNIYIVHGSRLEISDQLRHKPQGSDITLELSIQLVASHYDLHPVQKDHNGNKRNHFLFFCVILSIG